MLVLPIWASCVVLMLFMPITGVIGAVVVAWCVLVLPFKARRGACPKCQTRKTFLFSGFGGQCKGCGEELVLRGKLIHQLEPKARDARPGLGRSLR